MAQARLKIWSWPLCITIEGGARSQGNPNCLHGCIANRRKKKWENPTDFCFFEKKPKKLKNLKLLALVTWALRWPKQGWNLTADPFAPRPSLEQGPGATWAVYMDAQATIKQNVWETTTDLQPTYKSKGQEEKFAENLLALGPHGPSCWTHLCYKLQVIWTDHFSPSTYSCTPLLASKVGVWAISWANTMRKLCSPSK